VSEPEGVPLFDGAARVVARRDADGHEPPVLPARLPLRFPHPLGPSATLLAQIRDQLLRGKRPDDQAKVRTTLIFPTYSSHIILLTY
jgi:hypothetical protein